MTQWCNLVRETKLLQGKDTLRCEVKKEQIVLFKREKENRTARVGRSQSGSGRAENGQAPVTPAGQARARQGPKPKKPRKARLESGRKQAQGKEERARGRRRQNLQDPLQFQDCETEHWTEPRILCKQRSSLKGSKKDRSPPPPPLPNSSPGRPTSDFWPPDPWKNTRVAL